MPTRWDRRRQVLGGNLGETWGREVFQSNLGLEEALGGESFKTQIEISLFYAALPGVDRLNLECQDDARDKSTTAH